MHACPECGKTMATAGGLEIHVQMAHAPEEPESVVAEDAFEAAPVPFREQASEPGPFAPSRPPVLRGYDPTIPLTALLVLAMFLGGLGAAIHRSTTHPVAASVASAASPDTPTTVVDDPPRAVTPSPTTPLTQPHLYARPPSGSQQAASSGTSVSCNPVIDSLRTRPSKRSADLADLMRANTFPSLPLAGFEHPVVQGLNRYTSAQQYLDNTAVSDPALWLAKMTANGFVTAEAVGFEVRGQFFGAQALRFASPSGAIDFNRSTLTGSCGTGQLENAQAMSGLTGGMTYLFLSPGAPPYRATFVAGDTVVRLNICHCVEAPDDQVLVGQWAQAVAARVGAS